MRLALRHASAWLAATCVVGCGGAPRPSTSRTEPVAVAQVGGRDLVVFPRPLEGHIALSVWFDAGTLDAPNASVALVAAELVASARDDVHATVSPDGIELRTLCTIAALDPCVHALAAQLAEIDVTEANVAAALSSVVARRERGLGSARREAETLATSAALGIALAPLGDAGDVVTTADVSRFVEAHLGTDRSLWIVIGEVTDDRVARSLADTPRRSASAERATRSIDDQAAAVRSEERHDRGMWAVARREENEANAMAVARAWSLRSAFVPELEVAAFPTRAGWVALASFAGDDVDVARWTNVEPWPSQEIEAHGDAWSLAGRVGARWAAG
ncbi:MAG: hypothetical protein J0L92_19915, partial [Deltaproteobacteria bacterium]|nr:hypothetical protein [Deltaproteobacteria bacterium]